MSPSVYDTAQAVRFSPAPEGPVPYRQYAALVPLGSRKRRQIAHLNPGAGTPTTFSWEAWGTSPDPGLLDETGGVGHNPAATAYWLQLAADRLDLAEYRQTAQRYLHQAARATRTGIAGVMPTVGLGVNLGPFWYPAPVPPLPDEKL